MGIPNIVFPDTTDVFDVPLTREPGGMYRKEGLLLEI